MGTYTLISGSLLFVLCCWISSVAADFFASDTMEERSHGVNFKDTQANSLVNTGVVGALILTVVCAQMQADKPSEDEFSFLSQMYQVFLVIGLYFSVNATALSSLCL